MTEPLSPTAWDAYITLSLANPFLAAFVQFLLLGTAGEVAAAMLRSGRRAFPFSPAKTALKAVGWGVLGLYIKCMFVVATAGTQALIPFFGGEAPGPDPSGLTLFGLAAATSTLMNLMLGPSMIGLHRIFDNAIDRVLRQPSAGWAGLAGAMGTLVWLWIPLHTLTFTQPKEVRIGIAAGLSLLLGIVMGAIHRPRSARN